MKPILICAYFVVLALSYAVAMPPFEASDEAAHFLYIHNLLETRALPLIAGRDEIAEREDSVGRWSIENHQPPLYYAAGALLISWTQRNDIEAYLEPNGLIFLRGLPQDNANKWLHSPNPPQGDTLVALWVLRLYSLGLSTTTLFLIYRAARLFAELIGEKTEAFALTVMLLVASIPTFIAIGASVNNDNLVTLLYTAGVYQTLRLWRYGITRRDTIILCLLLGMIALTKITGLTLFGVVYGTLALGVVMRRFTVRQAALIIGTTALTAAVFAGWWYIRNWSLYGDPLAVAATSTLWGREFSVATESGDVFAEISRIWRSFWMMMGHLHWPVWGPAWLYTYATIISLAGVTGLLMRVALRDKSSFALRSWRLVGSFFVLLLALLLPVLALVVGTRGVDISYGRLLFPSLVGFGPLLVVGWRRLSGRFAPLLIMPLAVMALLPGVRELPQAYPPLEIVETLPAEAVPVNVAADELTILAYETRDDVLAPGDAVRFWLYVRGANSENPALFATLLDPVTGQALGKTAVYPGTAPTDALTEDTIYRAPLRVRLDAAAEPLSPRAVRLQLGWQTMLDTNYLPLTRDDLPLASLILNAGVLIDPTYTTPAPQTPVNAVFSDFDGEDVIVLQGYTLETPHASPGDGLNLTLNWRVLDEMQADYVVTVQLLGEADALAGQDDGDVTGYPTSAWRMGPDVVDERTITVDAAAVPGKYRLAVGWYRLDDFARLPVRGANSTHNLVILTDSIEIAAR